MTRRDQDIESMFPRLTGIARDRDLSMESLTPRLNRLLTEEEIDADDLKIRDNDDVPDELKEAVRNLQDDSAEDQ